MKLVGGLLVLVLSMAALAGTAGLASLRGEDSCTDRFILEERSTVQASQALSLCAGSELSTYVVRRSRRPGL